MFRTSAGIVVTVPYHYNDRPSRSTVNRQLFTNATVLTDRYPLTSDGRACQSTCVLDRMGTTRFTAHQWPALPTRLPLVPNEHIRSANSLHHRSRHIQTYIRPKMMTRGVAKIHGRHDYAWPNSPPAIPQPIMIAITMQ